MRQKESRYSKLYFISDTFEPVLYGNKDWFRQGDAVFVWYSFMFERIHIMTNISSNDNDYIDLFWDALEGSVLYYTEMYSLTKDPKYIRALDQLENLMNTV